MNVLWRLSRVPGIAWYIVTLATGLALAFTFLFYPAIAGSSHAILDPDAHGPLAFGIWKLHAFSYFPDADPSTARGPLYPAMMAGLLALTNGWWPYSAQLAQCLIFGLLCLLVFSITEKLWCRPLAVLAAALCALHPFLIWYTSRIWIETLMIFLFTALIGGIVRLKQRPTPWNAVLVGVIIGLSVMAKSIYVPFLIITPALLWLLPPKQGVRPMLAAIVLVSGILVATPWTIRNGRLTGTYAPVVGNSGFTLHQGNDFVEDFAAAPFSVSGLHSLSVARMKDEDVSAPDGTSALIRQNALDAAHGRIALAHMIDSPLFLLKKITYNLLFFWTLGDSPSKSALIAVLQLPLVFLCIASLIRARRRRGDTGTIRICAAVVALFYAAHLPTLAIARYSVVLVPAMLIIAVGVFHDRSLNSPPSLSAGAI